MTREIASVTGRRATQRVGRHSSFSVYPPYLPHPLIPLPNSSSLTRAGEAPSSGRAPAACGETSCFRRVRWNIVSNHWRCESSEHIGEGVHDFADGDAHADGVDECGQDVLV